MGMATGVVENEVQAHVVANNVSLDGCGSTVSYLFKYKVGSKSPQHPASSVPLERLNLKFKCGRSADEKLKNK